MTSKTTTHKTTTSKATTEATSSPVTLDRLAACLAATGAEGGDPPTGELERLLALGEKYKRRSVRHKQGARDFAGYLRRRTGCSKTQAEAAANAYFAEQEELPGFDNAWDRTAPSSTSPRRNTILDSHELAGVRRLPAVAWFRDYMAKRPMGRPAKRSPVVDCLLYQAFNDQHPNTKACWDDMRQADPVLGWALDYPDASLTLNAVYESQASLIRDRPAAPTIPVAVELIRKLAELPAPGDPSKRRFPNLARRVQADGMPVQADLPQRPKPREQFERDRPAGMEMACQAIHSDNDGNITKQWVGYKLVVLSCMDSNLPIAWNLVPGTANERDAALELIRLVFDLWEDFPIEVLVGDSLYDHSEEFADTLIHDYGIQPVFVRHGKVSATYRYNDDGKTGIDGVPCCKHGPMSMNGVEGRLTRAGRANAGLKPGERATGTMRIKWHCPEDECRGCDTRPADNPRLYTVYPRAGNSPRRMEREALLARRNGAESINSLIQWRGLAGKDGNRARKATDKRVDWLLSLGLLYITARRYLHETGLYDCIRQEAADLGLDRPATPSTPNPGPDAVTLRRVKQKYAKHWGPPRPPRNTAIDTDGYYLVEDEPTRWAA